MSARQQMKVTPNSLKLVAEPGQIACRASGLTVAHLLGHASTQILPTHVKPLDENTKAVIEALDLARVSDATRAAAGFWGGA